MNLHPLRYADEERQHAASSLSGSNAVVEVDNTAMKAPPLLGGDGLIFSMLSYPALPRADVTKDLPTPPVAQEMISRETLVGEATHPLDHDRLARANPHLGTPLLTLGEVTLDLTRHQTTAASLKKASRVWTGYAKADPR